MSERLSLNLAKKIVSAYDVGDIPIEREEYGEWFDAIVYQIYKSKC